MALLGMTDRLVYIRRFYGSRMIVRTNVVTRISRQPSPVQIMMWQTKMDIVEYYKYFRRMITNDAMYKWN